MQYSDMIRSDIEAAQRIQERYNYFLVSLIFTTLAFSIQTTTTDGPSFRIAAELFAWLFLLLAGAFGLSRWRYIPVIHGYSVQLITLSENIEKARKIKSEGHEMLDAGKFGKGSVEEFITKNQEAMDRVEKQREDLNWKLKKIAISHRVFILLGFIALMTSRGYEHVHILINSLDG